MAATNTFKFSLYITLLYISLDAAAAEDNIHGSIDYYEIDPGLTIEKPVISVSRDLTQFTNLSARITADRVEKDFSGVDAVSGATQYIGASGTGGTETRKEIAVGVSHTTGPWKIEPGYVLSKEDDYTSHVPSISVSMDLFQRNTTLALGYAHNFDEISGIYQTVSEKKDENSFAISLTQVVSPMAVAQVGYTASKGNGYMGTGNRKVRLENGQDMDEYLPEERLKEAVGIRIAQWLPTYGSIQVSYRFYRDDWKIDSNTFQFQIYQYITDALLVRGEYRYYDQSGAYFVRDLYTGSERYLTSAGTLGVFSSDLYGVKLIYSLKRAGDWDIEAKYERYIQSIDLDANIYMLGVKYIF